MAIASAPMPPDLARRLAAFLRRERDGIIQDWEAAVRKRGDGRDLSPSALRDHLPQLLDQLAALADPDRLAGENPFAAIHALQRLDLGFDLATVVEEYGTLRQAVLARWSSDGGSGFAIPLLHEVLDAAIATAVDRYTETRHRTLVALGRISAAALETPDLDTYLQQLIEVLLHENPAIDTVAVLLVEPDGMLRVRATVGLETDLGSFAVQPGEGFSGTVAASAQPLELRDAAHDPMVRSEALRARGARTLYGVPMVQQGQVIGVAHMSSCTANEFSDEDKLLLRAMVERASAGVVQHQLRAALQAQGRNLDAERRRLSVMLDLLPVGLLVLDRFGRLQAVNRAFRAIWGEGAPVGTGPEDGSFDDRAWWAESGRPVGPTEWGARRALARGEESRDETIEIVAFDGRRRTILHSASPLRSEDGEIVGAIAAMIDITERRRAEDERAFLAEAGRLLATSLDIDESLRQLAALVVPRFADGCVVDRIEPTGRMNEVALFLHDPEKQRLAEEFVRARGCADGVRSQVIGEGRSILVREAFPDGMASRFTPEEIEFARAIGLVSSVTVPLQAHGRTVGILSLLSTESGRLFEERDLALAQELGLRVATAVENAQLYADAQEAIRARDETWAIASHELRNPLAALRLQVRAAERQIEKNPEAPLRDLAPRLAAAERGVQRLIQLTSDLLDTTRAQAGRFDLRVEPFDLAELVREVADAHAYESASASAPIELRLEEGLVGCFDRSRLEQVLTNLLGNAIKYGPDAPIEVRLRREGDEAVLEVEDRGMGIPSEDLDRIFTPFERTRASRRKKGVGLGLYIVRRIVESHGGSISVRSEVDRGSTFTVRLPLGACPEEAPEQPAG